MSPQTLGQAPTPLIFLTQVWQVGGIEDPAIAGGATIDMTAGIIRAPMPSRRIAVRRDIPDLDCGSTIRSCSRSALLSLFKVNHTASTLTGDCHSFSIISAISSGVERPSQRFQTKAAVRFRQWALWFLRSYTSTSSGNS